MKKNINDEKKDSLYLETLRANKIPVRTQWKNSESANQSEIALLTATLAKGYPAEINAMDLSLKALEIWESSGKALQLDRLSVTLARGLQIYKISDWMEHGKLLVWALTPPGLFVDHDWDPFIKATTTSRIKAGELILSRWLSNQIPHGKYFNETVPQELFPGKAETTTTRQHKVIELLKFIAREALPGTTPESYNKILAWIAVTTDPIVFIPVPGHISEFKMDGVHYEKVRKIISYLEHPESYFEKTKIFDAVHAVLLRMLVYAKQKRYSDAKRKSE